MKLPDNVRRQVKEDALRRVMQLYAPETVNLHLYDEVLEAGQTLKAGPWGLRLERNATLVFADLAPTRNWAHPCQYLLHDPDSGRIIDRVDARFPPFSFFTSPERFEPFHSPVKQIEIERVIPPAAAPIPTLVRALADVPGTRYAILFSGMSNNRHVNDMEFLYRTLIDLYAFDPANIYVLNYNGTLDYNRGPHPIQNWPGDNTPYRMPIHGQGTQHDFESVIQTLSTRIRQDDLLFIHTNNHGAGPGDGVNDYCLCAYGAQNWDPYYAPDFVAALHSLPQFEALIVMMEQCRSGGFINPIINNSPARRTHVATAVKDTDYSAGGANFDPFAYDWIAGITGSYPNSAALKQVVDTNNDGRISAAEAFEYAKAVKVPADSPVSQDKPAGAGSHLFLGLPDFVHILVFPRPRIPVFPTPTPTPAPTLPPTAPAPPSPRVVVQVPTPPPPLSPPQIVLCPSCRTPNALGANYCRNCGRRL